MIWPYLTFRASFDSLDDCREKVDDPRVSGSLISDRCIPKAATTCSAWLTRASASSNTNINRFTELADFKGQKIRTMENSYHLAFWKALGANPTPMSFSEVYIGLQQHTIDAQENSVRGYRVQPSLRTAGLRGGNESSSAPHLPDCQ